MRALIWSMLAITLFLLYIRLSPINDVWLYSIITDNIKNLGDGEEAELNTEIIAIGIQLLYSLTTTTITMLIITKVAVKRKARRGCEK